MADDLNAGESIVGTGSEDFISTGNGDDSVIAGGGDDVVETGAGADTVQGDSVSEALGPDLLINGAVEAGVGANSWALNGNPEGWQSSQGGIESWGGNFIKPSEDGGNIIELDRNSGQLDSIYQDVQTEAGQDYVLSFKVANRPGTEDSVEVSFGGQKVETHKISTDGNWETVEITVTGTGGEDRLEFTELGAEDNSLGVLLDAISLRAVGGEAGSDFIRGGAGDDSLTGDLGQADGYHLGENLINREDLLGEASSGQTRLIQSLTGLSAGSTYQMTLDMPAVPADAEEVVISFRGEEIMRIGAADLDVAQTIVVNVDGIAGDEFDEIEIDGIDVVSIGDVTLQEVLSQGAADRIHGNEGDDSISGEGGNDLLVGDGVGAEWAFVGGRWVYDGSKLVINENDGYVIPEDDDTIDGGDGMDVLLGQRGDDVLSGHNGRDTLIGGKGDDEVYGGRDNDLLHLEQGDDYGVGGHGADTINGGSGDDTIYGDSTTDNVLAAGNQGAQSMSQHGEGGTWTVGSDPDTGTQTMSQTITTTPGTNYNLEFDVAANLAGGASTGKVEILWNGEVVDTVSVDGSVFQKFEVNVKGTGNEDELTFRTIEVVEPSDGPEIHSDHPISYYESQIEVGGEAVDVAAFAPGQAKLYQVITGQLKVFDPVAEDYQDAGPPTGLHMNAVGYNVEDDMLYGLARRDGADALGNTVDRNDVVAIDAKGSVYRIGESGTNSFIGDFDSDGNLWTFAGSLNSATMIDVNNIGPDGNPVSVKFNLPNDAFPGRCFDVAYNAEDNAFYTVEAPSKHGEAGTVHRIDLSDVPNGGEPIVTSVPIAGTLIDDVMKSGFPKGAFGAVFMDGEGNLYAGLNSGDHDLGAEAASGGIYKINIDWDQGVAHGELKAAAQKTGNNDGAVDPRSSDAFAEVDTSASVLIKAPVLFEATSGNDVLRGGSGEDLIYGGNKGDKIFGGAGNDEVHGDEGNDKMRGNDGDDVMFGGEGNDRMDGGAGDDQMSGGNGNDVLFGGASGNDQIDGGEGDDKLFGKSGDDTLDGGDGDDRVVGGGGADIVKGGDGDDKVFGGKDDDQIFGGEGSDTAFGGSGSDEMFGGLGADTLKGGAGDDELSGGADKDMLAGGAGADKLFGGDGIDKLVGGAGADTLEGGEGDDHMWGGKWSADGAADVFVKTQGTGTDYIHDFEAGADVVDLSAYNISFDDLQGAIQDVGWATQIELTGFSGEQGDRIFLKSVDKDDLSEDNFNL